MNENTIDLTKMQNLLNGFEEGTQTTINTNIDSSTTKYHSSVEDITFKDLQIEYNHEDNINIDLNDFMKILNTKGRVSGYADIVDIDKLYDSIIKNISIEDLKHAKGSIFTFIANKDVSMFAIGDLMEKIQNEINMECEVLFEINTTSSLSVNQIGYKILITGIEKEI